LLPIKGGWEGGVLHRYYAIMPLFCVENGLFF